jgi:hypothetical protein
MCGQCLVFTDSYVPAPTARLDRSEAALQLSENTALLAILKEGRWLPVDWGIINLRLDGWIYYGDWVRRLRFAATNWPVVHPPGDMCAWRAMEMEMMMMMMMMMMTAAAGEN